MESANEVGPRAHRSSMRHSADIRLSPLARADNDAMEKDTIKEFDDRTTDRSLFCALLAWFGRNSRRKCIMTRLERWTDTRQTNIQIDRQTDRHHFSRDCLERSFDCVRGKGATMKFERKDEDTTMVWFHFLESRGRRFD